MPRGIGPRQPRWVKSGKAPEKKLSPVSSRVLTDGKSSVAGRASSAKAAASAKANGRAQASSSPANKPAKKAPATGQKLVAPPKGYKPTAPERVTDILKRLDDKYGNVNCALHHNSAWE